MQGLGTAVSGASVVGKICSQSDEPKILDAVCLHENGVCARMTVGIHRGNANIRQRHCHILSN